MQFKNRVKAKLSAGETVVGTWSVIPSASVANILAGAGLDFIIIDMEHGPASFSEAEDMLRAVENEGRTPLLRVPRNDASIILRGLEIGSHGIVIPQISSAEEARSAVQAVKYHPLGQRGFSPFTRSAGYSHRNAHRIAEQKNRETMVVLLVEGVCGINNIEQILEVPDVDVLYIGLYDLSQAVGKPGQIDDPEIWSLLERCANLVNSRGLALGTIATRAEDIARYRALGVRFVAYQADCSLLFEACSALVDRFHRA